MALRAESLIDSGSHLRITGVVLAEVAYVMETFYFGNAGCHLPHGMSYPVSGMVHNLDFTVEGYPTGVSMCPHGMSVILNAPPSSGSQPRPIPEGTCTPRG